MLEKNVLITGSSGLIGTRLTQLLIDNGYKVSNLTNNRNKAHSASNSFYWNIEEGFIDEAAFNKVDYVINLAGASIGGGLWTKKRKKLIYDSRVMGTRLLFDAMTEYNMSLKGYFGASAVGYYGSNESDVPNVETDDFGKGFLAEVCVDWEKEHAKFHSISENVCVGRISNVISKYGGLADPYKIFSKFGVQIRFSKDSQLSAWISLEDLSNSIFQLLTSPADGTFNLSADVINWGRLQKDIYSSLGRQWLSIRIPSFMLKIMMGEMSSLMLFSSNVSNKKLLQSSIRPAIGDVQAAMI